MIHSCILSSLVYSLENVNEFLNDYFAVLPMRKFNVESIMFPAAIINKRKEKREKLLLRKENVVDFYICFINICFKKVGKYCDKRTSFI